LHLFVRAALAFTMTLLSAGIARAQTLAENESACASQDITLPPPLAYRLQKSAIKDSSAAIVHLPP
jgi:hypothetical protein